LKLNIKDNKKGPLGRRTL